MKLFYKSSSSVINWSEYNTIISVLNFSEKIQYNFECLNLFWYTIISKLYAENKEFRAWHDKSQICDNSNLNLGDEFSVQSSILHYLGCFCVKVNQASELVCLKYTSTYLPFTESISLYI